ncbi:LysR family transcriptional regulator [Aliikangiella marina]|uniref:LysR family transcriptional regulator n=1 Tax=Aliikangiella marina TaxID=1712262 RepID=A0A545T9H5_9GAMM|nr:LysR family transcriptional regulator [Aliikangiella marina]TQV73862.1 LysR family transcriptional regulator [Aliikangiella marina]
MHRWQGFEEFVQVVKAGSFSGAARLMGVSKGYISQQVSKLEDRLASRLLHRTTRKLHLTETGEIYYKHCVQIIQDLDEAEYAVSHSRDRVQGVLRISSPHLLGETYLVPAIAEFLEQHPRLEIALDFSSKKIDLLDDQYDVAIQVGKRDDVNVVNQLLATTRFHIVASQEYLSNSSALDRPEDLKRHNCLLFEERGVVKPWLLKKENEAQTTAIKVKSHWRSNSGPAIRAAALNNLGVAYLPDYYLKDWIKSRQLEVLLSDWTHIERQIVAIYPHKNYVLAKTRLFIDFLGEFFQRSKNQLTLS